jgi:hypothetical protein
MSTPEKEFDVVFKSPKGKLAISNECHYTKIRCNVCWKEGCWQPYKLTALNPIRYQAMDGKTYTIVVWLCSEECINMMIFQRLI